MCNLGKTKNMVAGHRQGVMANKQITVVANTYGTAKTFKYIDSLFTKRNCIREEITCRLKATKLRY
jgi:hypothetical protein